METYHTVNIMSFYTGIRFDRIRVSRESIFGIPSSKSSIMVCFDITTFWSCGSSVYDLQLG